LQPLSCDSCDPILLGWMKQKHCALDAPCAADPLYGVLLLVVEEASAADGGGHGAHVLAGADGPHSQALRGDDPPVVRLASYQ